MALKHSYSLLASIYDPLIESSTAHWRQYSINQISPDEKKNILINGIGSGLDIPFLPAEHHYVGTDITPAMLKRAEKRAAQSACNINLQIADSMALPFNDQSFDIVLMHLILAVVPDPAKALAEANRVLKPGGKIHIFDKFLKPGQLAPCRRLINLFSRHIATRTDVVFEELLAVEEELTLRHEEPALARGWFRFIVLEKN